MLIEPLPGIGQVGVFGQRPQAGPDPGRRPPLQQDAAILVFDHQHVRRCAAAVACRVWAMAVRRCGRHGTRCSPAGSGTTRRPDRCACTGSRRNPSAPACSRPGARPAAATPRSPTAASRWRACPASLRCHAPAQHALDVAVQDRRAIAPGLRKDRACRTAADAGQRAQGVEHRGAMRLRAVDADLRRRVQVAGTGVVAKPGPQREDFVLRCRGKSPERRAARSRIARSREWPRATWVCCSMISESQTR